MNTGTPIDKLQKAIERRQKELLAATEVLAKNARWFSARASIVTVLTVVLGAFVATRDGLSKLFPETQFHGSEFVLGILFLLVGLIIACVAGIEAAFRFRDKAAELRALSATCAATRRRIDTQWRVEVFPFINQNQGFTAAQALLQSQDDALADVHSKAANLGVHITLETSELLGPEDLHPA